MSLMNINIEENCDSFMDYDTGERTEAAILTDPDSLLFLTRRNSSRGNLRRGIDDKENGLSRNILLKSKSLPRTNSALKKNSNSFVCSRTTGEPLGFIAISRSSSLQNSDFFLKTSNTQDKDKGALYLEDGDFSKNSYQVNIKVKVHHQVSTEEFSEVTECRSFCVGKEGQLVEGSTCGDTSHSENTEKLPEGTQENVGSFFNDEQKDNEGLCEMANALKNSCENSESRHCVNQDTEQLDEERNQEPEQVNEAISNFPVVDLQNGANESMKNFEQNEEVLDSLSHVENNDQSVTSSETVELCRGEYQHPTDYLNKGLKGNGEEAFQTKHLNADKPMDPTGKSFAEETDLYQEEKVLHSNVNTKQLSTKSVDMQALDMPTEDQFSSQNINQKAYSNLPSYEVPQTKHIEEDVSSLFERREYVKIVLNWLRRGSTTIQATNTGGEEQSSNLAITSGNECLARPPKRRVSLPSENSPVKKKAKTLSPSPRKGLMITRLSINLLKRQSPNRTAAHIAQKRVQVFKAVEEGDLDALRKLLTETGPSIRNSKKNNTLLHTAAVNDQTDVFIHLLNLISPNVINRDSQTPAHVAASKGHTNILKILSSDKEFDPDKRDAKQRTFKDLLVAPLFKAVLNGDKKTAKTFLKLGADPDGHAGELVTGVLARELRVTSPRQLANTLYGQQFFGSFPQVFSPVCNDVSSDATDIFEAGQKTGLNCGGYVYVLNYHSFAGNPELDRKNASFKMLDIMQLFKGAGYNGNIHTSLTLDETKKRLTSLRSSSVFLKSKWAVFIISSYGVNKSFLTSDLKVLTTNWVMGLFRDLACPQLKNKPILFILDFDSDYHLEKNKLSHTEITPRVAEPLNNMISLSSVNLLARGASERSSFLAVLAKTLRYHGKGKDITEVYRELIKAYAKLGLSPLPEISNFGFTGKLCLIP
ncbi:uncharacterized protein [Palaemon carinicauda]|uniref:uncharacterized protein isoform X2 n=1 Tax=Palaemon carinicauda TaxID=392227 RepID=UPI0035B66AE6